MTEYVEVIEEEEEIDCAGFFLVEDYLALPKDPQPWIIDKLIPAGGLVNLYGIPKTGKSFAGIGLGIAIANDRVEEWLGFKVQKHGKVAYLQVDTPRSAWHDRLTNIREHGYETGQFYVADKLTAPYPFDILNPRHAAWLKKKVKQIDPILVVFDTLREIHGGDENDSTVMRNVIAELVSACGQDRAIVLVSHSRKLPAGAAGAFAMDDLMNDARGSSYVSGRMDSVLKLSQKTMSYKGRSVEHGSIKVMQDKETGLVITDKDAVEQERKIDAIMRSRDKSAYKSVSTAKIVEETGLSLTTAKSRFDAWVRKHEGKDALEAYKRKGGE